MATRIKLNRDVEPDIPCACDNCDWIGPATQVDDIQDPGERLDPGSEVPVGECPECGCLAYLVDGEET